MAENKKAVERRRKKKDVVIAQVPESPEITTEPPINDRSTAARALPKSTDQKHQTIGAFFQQQKTQSNSEKSLTEAIISSEGLDG